MQSCPLNIKEGATPKYAFIACGPVPSITTVSKSVHWLELLLGWLLLVASSSNQKHDMQAIKLS